MSGVRILNDRRLIQLAVALAARDHRRAARDCLANPRFDTLARAVVQHRAEIGLVVQRIAHHQLVGGGDVLVAELGVAAALDVNALDADADLPAVGEAAHDVLADGGVKIAGFVDDGRGVAAQFEQDFANPRDLADRVGDRDAARKRDHGDARVGDQPVAHVRAADDDFERAFGQPRFAQNVGEMERGQRRVGIRLEDNWTARRNRRGDFVRDQIEREIERRDRGDHADRDAHVVANFARAPFRGIQRDGFAVQAAGGVGGEGEGFDAAADFAARIFHRLAAFLRHRPRDVAGFILDYLGGFAEDRRAALRGHVRHRCGDGGSPPNRRATSASPASGTVSTTLSSYGLITSSVFGMVFCTKSIIFSDV